MGKLYGVGVGPGDPDLLTLKAWRVLREVEHLFVASSSKNLYSLAKEVIAPHLPPGKEVKRLSFPMTYEEEELQKAWRQNAFLVAKSLDSGDAAFLTLGDPCLYSTFGYLVREILQIKPELEFEIIPGITAAQAAAAKLKLSLAEGEEALLLLPGTNPARLKKWIGEAETLVIYKVYRQAEKILEIIQKAGKGAKLRAISHCGMPQEKIYSPPSAEQTYPYFTLFIVGGKPLK